MNYFNTIETALRALRAQQKAMQVTGHNVANANTEGYSRQRAIQTATRPYAYPGMNMPAGAGQVGTGVEVSQIERVRDQFIDGQIREEAQSLGYWEQRYQGLHRMELIFNEPSDTSLSFVFNEFWKSLEDLSVYPEDTATRATVRQRALNLVDGFHSLDDQLVDYKRALNEDVKTTVEEINSLARRIADLNEQIVNVETTGQKANDLMDQRDLLFERLSKLVNVRGSVDGENNLSVTLGGSTLISYGEVHELETVPSGNAEDAVIFKGTSVAVNATGGKLHGLLELRDKEIDDYIGKLDDLASRLITAFNNSHNSGYGLDGSTGIDFFRGSDAATIDITDEIKDPVDGLNRIAAAKDVDGDGTPDIPGDGSNALDLAEVVRESKLFSSNTASFMDYYQSMISTLGVEGQRADQMVANQNVLVDQLKNQRNSISGVSLDEEMANIVKFQQAYNAAAKMISRSDQMLETLLSII
ncbi:MAG: flagellar hook-associated protein FlgK [Halanaerobium sp.]|nr:flagellar hook-associated protein FlgK [Halanaerobium sp.]